MKNIFYVPAALAAATSPRPSQQPFAAASCNNNRLSFVHFLVQHCLHVQLEKNFLSVFEMPVSIGADG